MLEGKHATPGPLLQNVLVDVLAVLLLSNGQIALHFLEDSGSGLQDAVVLVCLHLRFSGAQIC